MSRRINTGRQQQLDLKLNLSQPRGSRAQAATTTSPDTSPPSSCVSSEESLKYSSSPEAASMVLVGCPRCLMYVMLSESDPKCPKCKSTVLLDFLCDDASTNHHRGNHRGAAKKKSRN